MTEYSIVPAYPEGLKELLANLRQIDFDDLQASGGTIEDVEKGLFRVSRDTYLGLADDKVMCGFGTIPKTIIGGQAAIWLFGTPLIEQHVRAFWKFSKAYVAYERQRYEVLTGSVWEGNVKSIRWLKKLGFAFSDVPHKFNTGEGIYYSFRWEKTT